MSEKRLREGALEEFDYLDDDIEAQLPADDTRPDEHGNVPKPCVRCQREPAIENPVKTTNRSLDEVNGRVYIDPVCEHHDNRSPNRLVWRMLSYADMDFVAMGVRSGVFSREEAITALGDGPADDYWYVPDDYDHDPDGLVEDLKDELDETE